jgi:hypothetical protein
LPLPINVVIVIEFGIGVGEGVGVGPVVGGGLVVGVGLGSDEEVGVVSSATANELLVPEWLPSVAVIVTPELLEGIVTEVDPRPATKAVITVGLIEPPEHVKDGAPT